MSTSSDYYQLEELVSFNGKKPNVTSSWTSGTPYLNLISYILLAITIGIILWLWPPGFLVMHDAAGNPILNWGALVLTAIILALIFFFFLWILSKSNCFKFW